jgi:hypothetical protein
MSLFFALAMAKDDPFVHSVLPNKPQKGSYVSSYRYEDNISVPLEKARNLKGKNIGVLFIGRVTGAEFIKYNSGVTATISSPHESFYTVYGVPFDLKKIIYYVVQTGEILGQKEPPISNSVEEVIH